MSNTLSAGVHLTGERRRSVLTDEDFDRIENSIKKEFIAHDLVLGIDSSTFEGVQKYRNIIAWAEGGMENTASAKKYVLAGLIALIAAACKGLWALYEGMATWIAIHR